MGKIISRRERVYPQKIARAGGALRVPLTTLVPPQYPSNPFTSSPVAPNPSPALNPLTPCATIPVVQPEFSQAFAFEIALGWLTPQEVRAHYGVSDEEWDSLRESEEFKSTLASHLAYIQAQGVDFKRMAQVASRHVMAVVHRLAHDPAAPPSVQLSAAQTIVKWAGHDQPEQPQVGPVVQMFFGSPDSLPKEVAVIDAPHTLKVPSGVRMELGS